MWEFPLTIMDGYLPPKFEDAKRETLRRLKKAGEMGLRYVTILFHDPLFDDAYSDMRDWYIWLIDYIQNAVDDSFVSFHEAMCELEAENE